MYDSQVFPLFSTPIYKTKLFFNEKEKNILMNYITKLKYFKYDSDNGYTTKEKNILTKRIFLNTKKQINQHINKFVFDILELNKVNLYVSSSWINLHQKGDYAQPHIHQNSLFSGVLYLNVPEKNCGKITFHFPCQIPFFNTNTITPGVKNENIYNSHSYNFNPTNGDLLIFPSHVLHEVGMNKSDRGRYSLSFNYFAKGKISDEKTKELFI